ncbi:MAG: GntR family transcriptional regulator [Eubacterium sp.]|nr:GntR family transcriptional regulator [Eubacterium sp.]
MFKYMEIVNWVREQINTGALQTDSKLPTENEMIRQFNVSRQSVRRAIQELENEGLLRTVQGSGTYIQGPAAPHSNKIALALTNYEGQVFPSKVRGINRILEQNGYISNLFVMDDSVSKENQILETLLQDHYAGLLLDGTQSLLPRTDEALLRSVINSIPCIMVDSVYPGFGLPSVMIDDDAGGYLATKYLIENGHRQIAYVGRIDYIQSINRYKGYTRALRERGLSFNDENVFFYIYTQKSFIYDGSMGEQLLQTLRRCTAVFCFNDDLARNIIGFLNQNGIRVPEDISIVGYDNMPVPGYPLDLTSIIHPREKLGEKAAKNLLRLIQDPHFDASYLFTPQLYIGNSVIPR